MSISLMLPDGLSRWRRLAAAQSMKPERLQCAQSDKQSPRAGLPPAVVPQLERAAAHAELLIDPLGADVTSLGDHADRAGAPALQPAEGGSDQPAADSLPLRRAGDGEEADPAPAAGAQRDGDVAARRPVLARRRRRHQHDAVRVAAALLDPGGVECIATAAVKVRIVVAARLAVAGGGDAAELR